MKNVFTPKIKSITTKKVIKKDLLLNDKQKPKLHNKKINVVNDNLILTKTVDLNNVSKKDKKSPKFKTNFQIKNFHDATKIVTSSGSNSARLSYKTQESQKKL